MNDSRLLLRDWVVVFLYGVVLVAATITVAALLYSAVVSGAAADSPTVTLDDPINASTETQTDAEITITQGTLTVSGHATDDAGLSHIKLHRTYEYHGGDNRQTRRDSYYATPRASNGTFSHDVPLGTGTNELNISVVDETGYPTTIDVVVHVEDDTKPTADLDATREGRWVRLDGEVRDNVQVDTVHAGGQTVQIRTGKLDLARDAVGVDQRVPDPGGENVTVRVVDRAGNTREVALPISAAPTPTPSATPTATATATPATNATPTATPNATVTPTVTPPRATTGTPEPEGGGVGLLGIVGLVVVVGGGLLMLNAGGGW